MPDYTRQEFIYKDGGTVTLDWAFANGAENDGLKTPLKDLKPIIIMAPGINNDSNEIYMLNFARNATL